MSASTLTISGSAQASAERSLARRTSRAALRPLAVLYARQPQLTTAAVISVLAVLPCLFAMLLDARTVNDINVWIKPTKFLVSFAVYYATLAWAFGYLPRAAQDSMAGKFVIRGALLAGLLEMIWLVLAAANGVPSHFNFDSALWGAAYSLAGMGSLVLVGAILVQGVLIARQRTVPVAPALRWALAAGAVIASVGTLIVAGYLSAHGGHWVGGELSDADSLALLGWSRTGGDLRVAHFWALHAQQLVPAMGWLMAAAGFAHVRGGMILGALAYVGLIAFTFVQALHGEPFLAFLS